MLSHRDRARLFLENYDVRGYAPAYIDALADLIAQGVEAEREECARVAEKTAVHGNRAIAALIRARNEPTK